jgi:F-type H+-transporting ATPase subunit epsilon|tara:strand:- start:374 stop:778 length:405 start_codon:yes stop_codon:yes gene_type:complete
MELIILQADRTSINLDDVTSINVKTIDGEMTILPNHIGIVSALSIGEVHVKNESTDVNYAVHGGFIEVAGNKVVILADSCEVSDSIDSVRANEAKSRALKRIAGESIADEDVDFSRAKNALKRAELRLKINSTK